MNTDLQFNVIVTESYEKTITVTASSTEEAVHIVSNMWNHNDDILDSPTFKGVRYVVSGS